MPVVMLTVSRTAPAADKALTNNQPLVYAFLDPEGAKRKGAELRRQFEAAPMVFVLSTRFRLPAEGGKIDPWHAAAEVKRHLEGTYSRDKTGALVFNPNFDNAYLMDGDAESANAIWLRNWLYFLELAQRKGGYVVQIVVDPGLSHMQEAEADMAADWGVPVVRSSLSRSGPGGKALPGRSLGRWSGTSHGSCAWSRDAS